MWIHQRTSRNTAVSYPLWPLALIAFCTVGGVCVFIGRYPWASLAVLVVTLGLSAVAFEDRFGRWPWQRRSNPEFDLDPEPQPATTLASQVLKPYREKIVPTEQ